MVKLSSSLSVSNQSLIRAKPVCDPAGKWCDVKNGLRFLKLTVTKSGPGFVFKPNLIPMLAAKNVQCEISIQPRLVWRVTLSLLLGIHTSISKGTMKRNCHQDWLMGRCGRIQEAAGPAPKGNQGNCRLSHFLQPSLNYSWKWVVDFSQICRDLIHFLIVFMLRKSRPLSSFLQCCFHPRLLCKRQHLPM